MKDNTNFKEKVGFKNKSTKYKLAQATAAILQMAKEKDTKDQTASLANHIKAMESERVNNLDSVQLLHILKALESLGFAPDQFVIQNVENALMWRSRNDEIWYLMSYLGYLNETKHTSESRGDLYQKVCRSLARR